VFKYYGAAGKTNKNKDLARIVVGFVTPAFDLKIVNDLDKWFKELCTVNFHHTKMAMFRNPSTT